jgi:mannose-6-phosphate isomerase-like protein (cupin superfamily)
MLIYRWEAKIPPSPEQIKTMLRAEGLEPKDEIIEQDKRQVEKKHPFGEVRVVAEGELFLNVAGNQLLMRAGDRIEIPANTKHSYSAHSTAAATIYSHRPY